MYFPSASIKLLQDAVTKIQMSRSAFPVEAQNVDDYFEDSGSLKGSKYIVTFTDDFSRYTAAYEMTEKTGVAECLKEFITECRRLVAKPDLPIQRLRIDGGTEYLTTAMKQIYVDENIWVETSPPDTPKLYGT